jgi:hypothetical protein
MGDAGATRATTRGAAGEASEWISIAGVAGEFVIHDDTELNIGFVERRNLCELGSPRARSRSPTSSRAGAGEYRVRAYGFDPRRLR